MDVVDLPLMYGEVGKPHSGHDCFVFARNLYPQLCLWNICIGAMPVGRALVIALLCSAAHCHLFKHMHLTFHLGEDRPWSASRLLDYSSITARNLTRLFDISRRKAVL
jgi:hypothetical protein